AKGEPVMHVPAAFAVDAKGVKRQAILDWANGRLAVRIDTRGLVFPVLLDPIVETAFWQQAAAQATGGGPPARKDTAMAYDSVLGFSTMVGGDTLYSGGACSSDIWEFLGGQTGWSGGGTIPGQFHTR